MGFVEVPGEADLVTGLDAIRNIPGIGGVGQNLASEEGLDAAIFGERDLLGVAQVGVGLVLDHGGLAIDGGLEQAAQRVGGDALVLEQQVGLADGVGLGVDLLAVEVGGDLFSVLRGELLQRFFGEIGRASCRERV